MEKTVICDYWKNNICKHMNKPYNCKFAHGIDEINVVECIYGINCYNNNCNFNHGEVSTNKYMVYDVPIVYKRNNKKCKKTKNNFKNINFSENDNLLVIPNIPQKYIQDGIDDNVNIIKIINKEKCIKDKLNIKCQDHDKLLSIIDEFYIKKYNSMIKNKNKLISNIVNNNYKEIKILRDSNNKKDVIINNLNSENKLLKEYINEIKNNNTKKEKVENKIVNNNKIMKIYDKYIKIYELFTNNNYKTVNLDEIRKYTIDKNIYKVRQRATKVYNFCNKLNSGVIKYCLPISKIFNMVY